MRERIAVQKRPRGRPWTPLWGWACGAGCVGAGLAEGVLATPQASGWDCHAHIPCRQLGCRLPPAELSHEAGRLRDRSSRRARCPVHLARCWGCGQTMFVISTILPDAGRPCDRPSKRQGRAVLSARRRRLLREACAEEGVARRASRLRTAVPPSGIAILYKTGSPRSEALLGRLRGSRGARAADAVERASCECFSCPSCLNGELQVHAPHALPAAPMGWRSPGTKAHREQRQ